MSEESGFIDHENARFTTAPSAQNVANFGQHYNPNTQPAPLSLPPNAIQQDSCVNAFDSNTNQNFGSMNTMLDHDPFGLTGAIHFPPQFAYKAHGSGE